MNSTGTDNVITLDEFGKFLQENLGYIPYNIKDLFKEIDADNDGRISVLELVSTSNGN